MNSQHDQGSHLFLFRFWKGEAQEAKEARDHKEWSGKMQHVLCVEAHTFHDWHTLISLLPKMAETDGVEPGVSGAKKQESTE